MVSQSRINSPETFAPTPELWLADSTQSGYTNPKLYKPIAKKISPTHFGSVIDIDHIIELAKTCQGSRLLQEEIMKCSILDDMRYVFGIPVWQSS
jgi:hypothetical protein